jgi:heme A synthase
MIDAIFHAHSGLRYLVLLAAVVALVIQLVGTLRSAPYQRPSRISMAAYVGLLDLQALLGIVLVVLGCFYPAVIGHLMMMLFALIVVHACSVLARKQASGRRAHGIALAGVVISLALIVGGISAIGRTPVSTTGSPTCDAAHR